jgi:hypothetical protein
MGGAPDNPMAAMMAAMGNQGANTAGGALYDLF